MSSLLENGYDSGPSQEHILNLMDRGYAVYFGELATRSEVDREYYALVMPGAAHDMELHGLNTELEQEYLNLCAEALLHVPGLAAKEYEPVIRLTDKHVLKHPETRTGTTARTALIEATRAAKELGYSRQATKPDGFRRRSRLRQSQTRCRR